VYVKKNKYTVLYSGVWDDVRRRLEPLLWRLH